VISAPANCNCARVLDMRGRRRRAMTAALATGSDRRLPKQLAVGGRHRPDVAPLVILVTHGLDLVLIAQAR